MPLHRNNEDHGNMYADKSTGLCKKAVDERASNHRENQMTYNEEHGIVPPIKKKFVTLLRITAKFNRSLRYAEGYCGLQCHRQAKKP